MPAPRRTDRPGRTRRSPIDFPDLALRRAWRPSPRQYVQSRSPDRTMRPYPCGCSTTAVTTVAAAPAASCASTSCRSVSARQQRHVTGEQHQRARAPAQRRLGRQQRVRRPKLRLLDHESDVAPSLRAPLRRVRPCPTTTMVLTRAERRLPLEHVIDHRRAGDAVQHLRHARTSSACPCPRRGRRRGRRA